MHLDDERIQRVLHGELEASAKEAIERHLSGCASCRKRVEEARHEEAWIFDLLERADQPVADLEPRMLVHRARQERAAAWGRWAAGFALVVLAAGAAYTAPGLPVRGWVDRVVDWVAGRGAQDPKPGTGTSDGPATAGIAVAPGERLTIHFTLPQPTGVVVIALGTGPDVVARVRNGTAIFTTGADRLTVDNRGSVADYEIEVPRGAPWVEVVVGERRLFLKQGDRIDAEGAPDASGRYRFSIASGR